MHWKRGVASREGTEYYVLPLIVLVWSRGRVVVLSFFPWSFLS